MFIRFKTTSRARLVRTGAVALFALGALLTFAHSQPPAVQIRFLTPGGSGSGNGSSWAHAYATVEDALNGMQPGDTLLIKEGTYSPISTLGFPIDKQVNFYGGCAGDETSPVGRHGSPTVFEGTVGGSPARHVVSISGVVGAPGVLLDSIEIRGGNANTAQQNAGGGIHSFASDLYMTDCLVRDNRADQDGGGLYFDGGPGDAKTLDLKR